MKPCVIHADAASAPLPAGRTVRASRRRRLWELPRKFHCPLIGVCFDCDELRSLMSKVLHLPRQTADFVLHTTAVGNCAERSTLAELLQRRLEQRYRLTLQRFAACKELEALADAWDEAVRDGQQIPAALWAVWTHPACDERLAQEVYAEIHMIQHQVGASARVDAALLRRLQQEKAELQRALQQLGAECERWRCQHIDERAALEAELKRLRQQLAARTAWGEAQAQALAAARQPQPELASRLALQARCERLQRHNSRLKVALKEGEGEIARLRDLLHFAEEALESIVQEESAHAALEETDLSGKRVLCVGGRAGAIHAYRELVEQCGGRFLHHDGGLEENLHRIDGVVAAADIVICQTGCISHNAYWRVKDMCRRSGKPCLFVKSAGVRSFERVIDEAGRRAC